VGLDQGLKRGDARIALHASEFQV